MRLTEIFAIETDSFVQRFPKQALVFKCLQYKSFENTVGKSEIALNFKFLILPQCSTRFENVSSIFIKFNIVVCRLFQLGRV